MAFAWNSRLPQPTFEHVLGLCVALTLFSGAAEVPLYVALGIPPVLGGPFMALAGAAGLVAAIRLAPKFPAAPAVLIPIGFWLALIAWASLSATWSVADNLVTGKLALLLGVSTTFLVLGICTGFAADTFDAFFTSLFVIGLVTAATILIHANQGMPHLDSNAALALKTFEDAYQATTQCVSLAAMVALVHVLAGSRNRALTLAWAAGWIVLTVASLAGGGRGAAIGGALGQVSVLGFAIFVFWRRKGAAKLLGALLAVPLFVGGLLALGTLLELRGIERLAGIANSLTDETGRHELWAAALAMADSHPLFGAGLASFHASADNIESLGLYPHNVFLEVLAETGLVGFALFTGAFVAAAVATARRAREIPFVHGAVWLGIFVYTCFEMNVSGSVTGRTIAFIIGVSVGLAARFYALRKVRSEDSPALSARPV